MSVARSPTERALESLNREPTATKAMTANVGFKNYLLAVVWGFFVFISIGGIVIEYSSGIGYAIFWAVLAVLFGYLVYREVRPRAKGESPSAGSPRQEHRRGRESRSRVRTNG